MTDGEDDEEKEEEEEKEEGFITRWMDSFGDKNYRLIFDFFLRVYNFPPIIGRQASKTSGERARAREAGNEEMWATSVFPYIVCCCAG